VVVVPAIATYVATASSPELGSAHWVGAARVGTVAWLLAHGAAPSVAQATISVVPLGLTLVAFALLVGSVRRARLASWAAGGFAALAYVAFTTRSSPWPPRPAPPVRSRGRPCSLWSRCPAVCAAHPHHPGGAGSAAGSRSSRGRPPDWAGESWRCTWLWPQRRRSR